MIGALEHITISTGATRISLRSEVENHVIDAVRQALQPTATGREFAPWHIIVREIAPSVWDYDLLWSGILIARCMMCADPARSDALWEVASTWVIDEQVTLHRPRGVPWLGAALLPGALQAPSTALYECGDLERCVAWTLLSPSWGGK